MSNVIDFLQRLGQDADLRHATRAQVEQALDEAGIDCALREALLGADQRRLEALLGADTNVCAMIAPGRQEEDEEDDEDEDDFEDDEDEDGEEDDDEFDDDEDDEDDEDYEDDDEDYDEEEENSLIPRHSPVRRAG